MADTVLNVLTIAVIIAAPLLPISAPLAFALSAGAALGNAALKGKQDFSSGRRLASRRQQQLGTVASSNQALPIVYGQTLVGGTVCFVNQATDDDSGVTHFYMVEALTYASGSGVDSLTEVRLNGKVAITEAGSFTGSYSAANLLVNKHTGSDAQTVDTTLQTAFSTLIPNEFQGGGVSYVVVRLNGDKAAAGPPVIQVRVKGQRLYDPRTTSQSWSDNSALCVRDYLTNNTYGFGIDAAEIDDASFITEANHCDELVTVTSGSQKRYRCNGAISTGQSIWNNLDDLLSTCAGQIIYEGGKYRMFIPKSQTTFTGFAVNNDTVKGTFEITEGGVKEKFNIAEVTFIDANQEYQPQTVIYPSSSINNFLTEDSNYENRLHLELPLVTNKDQASQLGQIVLNQSRLAIGLDCICTDEALKVNYGTVLKVSLDGPVWNEKLFMVGGVGVVGMNSVKLGLVEYDSGVFNLSESFDDTAVVGTGLPDPFLTKVPDNVTLNSGTETDRLVVAWGIPTGTLLDNFEVQGRHETGSSTFDGDGIFKSFGFPNRDQSQHWITGVRQGQSWTARVRSRNTLGVNSEWSQSAAHVVQVHAEADPTFNVPVIEADGITYSWDYGFHVGRIKLYTRQVDLESGPDPGEITQYEAFNIARDEGVTSVNVGSDSGSYRKTIIRSFNLFDELGIKSETFSTLLDTGSLTGSGPAGAPTSLATPIISADGFAFSFTSGDVAASTDVELDQNVIQNLSGTLEAGSITGLQPDHSYSLDLRHLKEGKFSDYAGAITVNTIGGTLGAPQNLQGVGGHSLGQLEVANVYLSWRAGTDGDTASYRIFRDGSQIGTTSAGTTTFLHEDDSENLVSHNFKVKAVRTAWNDSPFTSEISVVYLRPDLVLL